MKRYAFAVLLLAVCLLASAALAAEVSIPATSEDALALAPVKIPAVPEMTVADDSDGKIYFLTGLDKWPLKNAKRYQKGLFRATRAGEDDLYAVKGQEEDPFSILVSKDDEVRARLKPSSGKYKELYLIFLPKQEEIKYQIDFSDRKKYVLDSRGTVYRYVFYSGKNYYDLYYDLQGFLTSVTYHHERFSAYYDALGELMEIHYTDKNKTQYVYDGKKWTKDWWEVCEMPKGFPMKEVPVLKLSSEENAERARARAAEAAACVPDAGQMTGADVISLFAPLPVVKEETDEKGNLSVIVSGLDAWGIRSQALQEQEENGYSEVSVPKYPLGTLILHVPAGKVESWWADGPSVFLSSPYKGVEVFLSYRDWAEAWSFSYHSAAGNVFRFILAEEPYLESWGYDLDDGRQIEYAYTRNGELAEISIDEETDIGSVYAFYSTSGVLRSIAIMQATLYEYDADAGQWTMQNSDSREKIPCEAPEGFDLSKYVELPPLE